MNCVVRMVAVLLCVSMAVAAPPHTSAHASNANPQAQAALPQFMAGPSVFIENQGT